MKIALDAMGGDDAPAAIVEGAVLAAREFDVEIILVGDEKEIQKELSRHPAQGLPLSIHHAPQRVAMHESPPRSSERSAILRFGSPPNSFKNPKRSR
ncbi:MAG: hypothetical protein MPW14_16585 [Candidatus Manganitrophus sp.]|nr:MAG: hypothetical protein MPW14_16585 [Candidatus Manganitrophus sp.]